MFKTTVFVWGIKLVDIINEWNYQIDRCFCNFIAWNYILKIYEWEGIGFSTSILIFFNIKHLEVVNNI